MFTIRQCLGKYRIEKRLAEGAHAVVYQAFDTIEGIRIALKAPLRELVGPSYLEEFRREVRLTAGLDHPNILTLKYAGFVDGHFVIVYPLGERSLAERLQSRMSMRTTLDLAEQMVEATACAHLHRIIHCDIKPENLILFSGNRLRLADFGIARVARGRLEASGSGTIGYIAPEQAVGKPSFRSDVFSLGLVMYRMLSGELPGWPYEWPLPGARSLRSRVHPDLLGVLERAIQLDPRDRFSDAKTMARALRQVRPRSLRFADARNAAKASTKVRRQAVTESRGRASGRDWQTVRKRQFERAYGRQLETSYACSCCHGPVSESMQGCPWCGRARLVHRDETRFPASCPRCHRGMKLDWRFCPWCYGAGFEPLSARQYSDTRYQARCANSRCSRKLLLPFMRYCPWCRRKVQRGWKIEGSKDRCDSCGWGVLRAFWNFCPWCCKSFSAGARSTRR
jgi:serine/threonine-protein kinase